jgi:prepilin-type N-terminal cleavage/methylation domain-containing protein
MLDDMLGFVRPSRVNRRGFSLAELMAVVAITGVLGAICTTLVIHHMNVARNLEGITGMQTLRGAAEAFKAENGRYPDCSLVSGPQWYPAITPSKTRYPWVLTTHPDWTQWRLLALPRTGVTRFGYLLNAGIPGGTLPVFRTTTAPPPTVPTEPWYVIQVKGDIDADSKAMVGFITSMNGEVYVENDSE